MMMDRPLTPRDAMEELDEMPREVFKPGELGRVMNVGLIDLVNHYMKDHPKKGLVVYFLKWVPPDHLEAFLVKCCEYGADKTRPETRKKTVRKQAKTEPKTGPQDPSPA